MRKETISIEYLTVSLEVQGIYTKEIPEVRYTWNGDGSPAEPASYEIEKVLVGGLDIYTMLSDKQLEEIELLCLNYYEN